MADLLELQGVVKSYGAAVKTTVLHGIDLRVKTGEFAAIIGQSGSGKTTLLNMIGALDRPDRGRILCEGRNLLDLDEQELAAFRNRMLGFVFQFHFLLPEFNALENVLMPYWVTHGRHDAKATARARELLDLVGVGHRMHNRATDLSGGQQQRVAIARALMNAPRLVLADEPTGNLDSDSAESINALLRNVNKEAGATFLIVTHDRHVAARCDRVIEMADGRVVDDVVIEGKDNREAWERLSPCYCRMRGAARAARESS